MKPPLPLAAIARKANRVASDHDWRPLSYSTVRSITTGLDPGMRTLAQQGTAAYRDTYELAWRHRAERPNAIWQADHTELDILVLDANLKPGRPWLTTIMDDYSRAICRRLHLKGIEWAPQAHGIDEAGREILDFVPGSVPSYPMPVWVWEDSFLVTAAGRLREFHDATAGLNIVDAVWKTPVHEPVEVICHNDFAPYNFVCRGSHFTGVIDWDTISPGPRIWDVAYLAYRLCPLAAPTNPDGRPGISSEDQGRRLGLLLGAYRADFTASEALMVAVERLEDLARFTAAEAQRQSRSDLAGHVNLYMNDIAYLQTARSRSWAPHKQASSSSHRGSEAPSFASGKGSPNGTAGIGKHAK